MKRNIYAVLIFALALVFLIGCTPTAKTQEAEKEEMTSEAMSTDDKDMESGEIDEEKSSEDSMTEDASHEDDMTSDDMTEDEMKDGDMEAMSEYKDISPQDAKELIDNTPDLVIIDVSPNYANGHLPGAINYYVGDGSLDNAIPTLDKNVPYLVYCHVDSASISGAQKLIDAGFPMVYRLEGNYSAWVDAGYDIEK